MLQAVGVRSFSFLVLLACATVSLSAQVLAPNLIYNGSFELPGLRGKDTQILTNSSNFIPGWTVLDDGRDLAPFYTTHNVAAGTYAVVLNQQSGLRTTVRATPGTFYELGLWVEADDCSSCVTPAPLRIRFGTNTVLLPLVSGRAYHRIQINAASSVNVLEIFNPSSTGSIKQYTIDDVSLRAVPATILSARLMPVLTIEGVIGARYEIQSTTNLTAANWTTLTNLVLSNSPTIYVDTNISLRGRIYRAVRIQ